MKKTNYLETDKLAELERKIEYIKLSTKNLQNSIADINTAISSLSSSVGTLAEQLGAINTEIGELPTPQTIDNELDFIFNGTYFSNDEYDEVIAGNYTDPQNE